MKKYLGLILFMLAFVFGAARASAQPALNIVPSGQNFILYWSPDITNSVLQSTTNLATPGWTTVTDAVPVIYGMQTAVAVTNCPSMRFFRLFLFSGMALVPAGSFTIGNSTGDPDITDADPTNVTVSAFYMDTNLVSYGQWLSVFNWANSNGYSFDSGDGLGQDTNQPVQTVDWYDCVKWCNARSQQAGFAPVYYTDAGFTQVYTNGDSDSIYANWAANGYRLPTEAEWEKAARGGLVGNRFPLGNTITDSAANYFCGDGTPDYDLSTYSGYNVYWDVYWGDNVPITSAVGYYPGNGYGLNDMAGNVFEWCWDWYEDQPYPDGSPYLGGTDPHGPDSSDYDARVSRGGAWDYDARYARCANRLITGPSAYNNDIGFRCVKAH